MIEHFEKMVKFAKDYYAEIGYPISHFANYEYKNFIIENPSDGSKSDYEAVYIYENLAKGIELTRAVSMFHNCIRIFDFRREPRVMIEKNLDCLIN